MEDLTISTQLASDLIARLKESGLSYLKAGPALVSLNPGTLPNPTLQNTKSPSLNQTAQYANDYLEGASDSNALVDTHPSFQPDNMWRYYHAAIVKRQEQNDAEAVTNSPFIQKSHIGITSNTSMAALSDLPAHIYQTAAAALAGAEFEKQTQAILLLGERGSGKSTNTRQVLRFLGTFSRISELRLKNCISNIEAHIAKSGLVRARNEAYRLSDATPQDPTAIPRSSRKTDVLRLSTTVPATTEELFLTANPLPPPPHTPSASSSVHIPGKSLEQRMLDALVVLDMFGGADDVCAGAPLAAGPSHPSDASVPTSPSSRTLLRWFAISRNSDGSIAHCVLRAPLLDAWRVACPPVTNASVLNQIRTRDAAYLDGHPVPIPTPGASDGAFVGSANFRSLYLLLTPGTLSPEDRTELHVRSNPAEYAYLRMYGAPACPVFDSEPIPATATDPAVSASATYLSSDAHPDLCGEKIRSVETAPTLPSLSVPKLQADVRALRTAFARLGLLAPAQYQIWRLVSAILLLGNLTFSTMPAKTSSQQSVTVVDSVSTLREVADLLKIAPAILESALVSPSKPKSNDANAGSEVYHAAVQTVSPEVAKLHADGLAITLYARLWSLLLMQINTAFAEAAAYQEVQRLEYRRFISNVLKSHKQHVPQEVQGSAGSFESALPRHLKQSAEACLAQGTAPVWIHVMEGPSSTSTHLPAPRDAAPDSVDASLLSLPLGLDALLANHAADAFEGIWRSIVTDGPLSMYTREGLEGGHALLQFLSQQRTESDSSDSADRDRLPYLPSSVAVAKLLAAFEGTSMDSTHTGPATGLIPLLSSAAGTVSLKSDVHRFPLLTSATPTSTSATTKPPGTTIVSPLRARSASSRRLDILSGMTSPTQSSESLCETHPLPPPSDHYPLAPGPWVPATADARFVQSLYAKLTPTSTLTSSTATFGVPMHPLTAPLPPPPIGTGLPNPLGLGRPTAEHIAQVTGSYGVNEFGVLNRTATLDAVSDSRQESVSPFFWISHSHGRSLYCGEGALSQAASLCGCTHGFSVAMASSSQSSAIPDLPRRHVSSLPSGFFPSSGRDLLLKQAHFPLLQLLLGGIQASATSTSAKPTPTAILPSAQLLPSLILGQKNVSPQAIASSFSRSASSSESDSTEYDDGTDFFPHFCSKSNPLGCFQHAVSMAVQTLRGFEPSQALNPDFVPKPVHIHFVRCLRPTAPAMPKMPAFTPVERAAGSALLPMRKASPAVSVTSVIALAEQIRASGIIAVAPLHYLGHPIALNHRNFYERYVLLAPTVFNTYGGTLFNKHQHLVPGVSVDELPVRRTQAVRALAAILYKEIYLPHAEKLVLLLRAGSRKSSGLLTTPLPEDYANPYKLLCEEASTLEQWVQARVSNPKLQAPAPLAIGVEQVLVTLPFFRCLERARTSLRTKEDVAASTLQAFFRYQYARKRYLAMRQAAIRVAAVYRGHRIHKAYKYYVRNAKIVKQFLITASVRTQYLKMRSAAVVIQRFFRSLITRAVLRTISAGIRATCLLATGYRLRRLLMQELSAIRTIQRAVRQWLLHRRREELREQLAIRVQSIWRGALSRAAHPEAVQLVQYIRAVFRGYRALAKCIATWRAREWSRQLQLLRACAIVIQRWWRAHKAKKERIARTRLAIVLQALYRGRKCRIEVSRMLALRAAELDHAQTKLLVAAESRMLGGSNINPQPDVTYPTSKKENHLKVNQLPPLASATAHEPSGLQLVDLSINTGFADKLQSAYYGNPKTAPDQTWSSAYSTLTTLLDSAEQSSKVIQVSQGLAHSAALDTRGNVWTWGSVDKGQLGTVQSAFGASAPRPVAALADATHPAHPHSADARTQVGAYIDSSETPSSLIALVTHAKNESVTSPEVSMYFTNQRPKGTLLRPKTDSSLQVPLNSHPLLAQLLSAALTTLPIPIQQVAAGGGHTLALSAGGFVYAWGDNRRGQCGVGDQHATLATPVLVPTLAALNVGILSMDFGVPVGNGFIDEPTPEDKASTPLMLGILRRPTRTLAQKLLHDMNMAHLAQLPSQENQAIPISCGIPVTHIAAGGASSFFVVGGASTASSAGSTPSSTSQVQPGLVFSCGVGVAAGFAPVQGTRTRTYSDMFTPRPLVTQHYVFSSFPTQENSGKSATSTSLYSTLTPRQLQATLMHTSRTLSRRDSFTKSKPPQGPPLPWNWSWPTLPSVLHKFQPLCGVTKVVSGKGHALALCTNGKVWAWGDNGYGQCGTGGGIIVAPPCPLPAPTPLHERPSAPADVYVDIACGAKSSFLVGKDGTLAVVGFNQPSDESAHPYPRAMPLPLPPLHWFAPELHKVLDAEKELYASEYTPFVRAVCAAGNQVLLIVELLGDKSDRHTLLYHLGGLGVIGSARMKNVSEEDFLPTPIPLKPRTRIPLSLFQIPWEDAPVSAPVVPLSIHTTGHWGLTLSFVRSGSCFAETEKQNKKAAPKIAVSLAKERVTATLFREAVGATVSATAGAGKNTPSRQRKNSLNTSDGQYNILLPK